MRVGPARFLQRGETRSKDLGFLMLQDVLKTVDENQHFVLTSHARPDGDAIGSVLACGAVLRQLGKTADVVLSDGVPVIYKPLPFADDVIHARAVSGNRAKRMARKPPRKKRECMAGPPGVEEARRSLAGRAFPGRGWEREGWPYSKEARLG